MNDIYATLREQMLRKTEGRPAEDFVIRGLWKTDLLFRPNADERTFKYTYVLAQTLGQGCCYCNANACLDQDILGCDARDIVGVRCPSSIAVLDSIYAGIARAPDEVHEIRGNSVEKTGARNSIIFREADRLLAGVTGREPRIVNVGLVGDLLRRLKARCHEVTATDYDEVVVGLSLHGVKIEHGFQTIDRVRESDLAVVTGMTLATDSLEKILDAARASGTKVLIFAETGANFGEEYVRTLGVDAVVAEPFPFYIFQGVSRIEVYRKSDCHAP